MTSFDCLVLLECFHQSLLPSAAQIDGSRLEQELPNSTYHAVILHEQPELFFRTEGA